MTIPAPFSGDFIVMFSFLAKFVKAEMNLLGKEYLGMLELMVDMMKPLSTSLCL